MASGAHCAALCATRAARVTPSGAGCAANSGAVAERKLASPAEQTFPARAYPLSEAFIDNRAGKVVPTAAPTVVQANLPGDGGVIETAPDTVVQALLRGDGGVIETWLIGGGCSCATFTNGELHGVSLLMAAAAKGNAPICVALLQHGANVDYRSPRRSHALLGSIYSGNDDVLTVLLQHGVLSILVASARRTFMTLPRHGL